MLRILNRKMQEQAPGKANMSFKIDTLFPDKVAERSGNFVIGARGRQMVYALQCYNISQNDISEMEKVKALTIERLLGNDSVVYSNESMELAKGIAKGALNSIETSEGKEMLAYLVAHDVVGYGPFSMLLEDSKNIEEIVVNTPTGNIGIYHAKYGFCITNLRFATEGDFRFMVNKLIEHSERGLNSMNPIIDAEIIQGSRIHAQIRPFAPSGAAASIRIGGKKNLDLRNLLKMNTATPEVFAYLWLAISARCNLIISGAPSSGKTTLLMALNAFMPRSERIVAIEEDANEIKYYSNFANAVNLQGSQSGPVTTKDQVINALHLRPDRLLVGELRGSEASEVFAGSNIGVPFMTTLHSSGNGMYILSRLGSKPMSVDNSLISMLDVSVFMKQNSLNTRVIESINEYRWLSRDEIDASEGAYRISEIAKDGNLNIGELGGSKVIERYASLHGIRASGAVKELKSRATFLKGMLQSSDEVHAYIERYS